MAFKPEVFIRPKNVKIFDRESYTELINGTQVAACMISASHNIIDEAGVINRLNILNQNGPSGGNSCSCCGIGPFKSREDQIAHYKQHWHTYNLKRKLFGKPALTLGQFNSRLDDDSSVSGSDSEDESPKEGSKSQPPSDLFAAATRHCKAFFNNQKGQVFCIYRCVLHHRKEELSTDGAGTAWLERVRRLSLPVSQRWAILMVSGGHFAGGIFDGGDPVVHKTLHSYVTRRGQGQAQVSRDQHKNVQKSAGSSLRRYNQAQFLEHVQEVISGWADELAKCELVLYRAVGFHNQSAIFNKGSTLKKEDLRVRQLPFPTRKPTYKEVQRVFDTLASIEVYQTKEQFQKALIAATTGTKPIKTSSDTSLEGAAVKKKKSPQKVFNRAKSRERAPRELPASESEQDDQGPCYIDSETPKDWIKTLSEQSIKGIITNSRKDLLNDSSITTPPYSESEREDEPEKERQGEKKQKSIAEKSHENKPQLPKISNDLKKMWKLILDPELTSLESVLAGWAGGACAALNTPDRDGNTALHKAAIAAKPDMVSQILIAGGDPCVKNNALQTPYAAGTHSDTRIAFRLFQGQFPDKYNYNKSQIPGPLTPELLEQETQKKSEQKRAKRQREKAKLIEKKNMEKFMQLSDAEKVKADERRCFLCGQPLPKLPFGYDKYSFCTIRCLHNHRNLRPLQMSA